MNDVLIMIGYATHNNDTCTSFVQKLVLKMRVNK